MTDDERMERALEYAFEGRKRIADADEEPDPVQRRRELVQAARLFRAAADVLDDSGRITE